MSVTSVLQSSDEIGELVANARVFSHHATASGLVQKKMLTLHALNKDQATVDTLFS